jgi:hypothetical protein
MYSQSEHSPRTISATLLMQLQTSGTTIRTATTVQEAYNLVFDAVSRVTGYIANNTLVWENGLPVRTDYADSDLSRASLDMKRNLDNCYKQLKSLVQAGSGATLLSDSTSPTDTEVQSVLHDVDSAFERLPTS